MHLSRETMFVYDYISIKNYKYNYIYINYISLPFSYTQNVITDSTYCHNLRLFLTYTVCWQMKCLSTTSNVGKGIHFRSRIELHQCKVQETVRIKENRHLRECSSNCKRKAITVGTDICSIGLNN